MVSSTWIWSLVPVSGLWLREGVHGFRPQGFTSRPRVSGAFPCNMNTLRPMTSVWWNYFFLLTQLLPNHPRNIRWVRGKWVSMKTWINMWKKYKLHAEQNIYIVSKYPFHKTPVNYRRQMSEFTWEKPGSHLLNKEIKMNIVNNETNWNVCAWEEEHSLTPVIGPPKTYNSNLITRKCQVNKFKGIVLNFWPVMFQSSRSIKVQKD